jgi:hypothetical protein
MGAACCTQCKNTNAYRGSVGKSEGTTDVLERSEGGKIILKLYRKNRVGSCGVNWSGGLLLARLHGMAGGRCHKLDRGLLSAGEGRGDRATVVSAHWLAYRENV